MSRQYAERDPIMQDRLGNYYCRHVSAMTAERLHAKSDIAAELAHRDIEIDRLTKLLDQRVELERASRPAGEAVAWLHDVVQSDGEQDQALSFSPDSFPLKGVGGFESIKSTPLFLAPQATHNKCDADFVALQIARRFVPYLEPQRRAQLQVAIRDAICKATDLELAQAERIEELETLLKDIGNYAHDHSTGPAVPDALWTIRKMAYDG